MTSNSPDSRPDAAAPRRRPERVANITDEDKENARHEIVKVFQLCGLVANGNYICPECGTSKKGKVKLKPATGTWSCYRCQNWGSTLGSKDTPGLLQSRCGYSFPDAVRVLLGKPLSDENRTVPVLGPAAELPIADNFRAAVDVDVYDAVVAAGHIQAAQAYYGQWHIEPDVVAESGAVVIVKPDHLLAALLAEFGRDRLVAGGYLKPGDLMESGKDYPLLNRSYNVVEPHHRPDGRVVGLQFRASVKQMEKIDAHKAYAKLRDAAEAQGLEYDGDKVDYVPKFLSLRGAGPASLVGCGLARIALLTPGQRIYIVEGFKDMLAARSMGAEAYAIPGVGVMPAPKVCEFLARHTAVICLDGDKAGDEGAERLAEHLKENGVPYEFKNLPRNQDVTDVLVGRSALNGHNCKACKEWRKRFVAPEAAPEDAPEAPPA